MLALKLLKLGPFLLKAFLIHLSTSSHNLILEIVELLL